MFRFFAFLSVESRLLAFLLSSQCSRVKAKGRTNESSSCEKNSQREFFFAARNRKLSLCSLLCFFHSAVLSHVCGEFCLLFREQQATRNFREKSSPYESRAKVCWFYQHWRWFYAAHSKLTRQSQSGSKVVDSTHIFVSTTPLCSRPL